MQPSWDSYFERLGPLGIRVTLAGLLEVGDGAKIGGSSLEVDDPFQRAELIADLLAVDPERTPVALELLDSRAAQQASNAGDDNDEAGARERLAIVLRNPDIIAASVLHRLARQPKAGVPNAELRAAAEVVAASVFGADLGSRPKYMAKLASERASSREFEQERREFEARLRQLETDLSRLSSERQDQLLREKDLREERARIERENARLQKRIDELVERRAREGTGEITTALRRLNAETRRIGAGLDKLRNRDAKDRELFRDISRRLGSLGDLLETLVQQAEASQRAAATAQEAILKQLGQIAAVVDPETAGAVDTPRRTRPRTEGRPRVALFVDVQNMFYGAREKGARVDFEALLSLASEDRQLVRAVAYVVETREIDQRAFIHLLEMKAYEVKRKGLRIRPDRTMKGNWDLEIALDALHTAPSVDVVVLVTGDGDFVPLVRQLKLVGKRVEVVGFTKSSAPDLREAADRFFPVSKRLLRPVGSSRAERADRSAQRASEPAAAADPAHNEESNNPDTPPPAEAKSAAPSRRE